jgi:DNA-binding transcriptional LysR family regulator
VDYLRVAFDQLPLARWGPLFHILTAEVPDVRPEWKPADFPTDGRSLLDAADVGLFVAPPPEPGLSTFMLETSPMVVVTAVGHRLAQKTELRLSDVLDETWPGGSHNAHWRSFWTLDEYRGGPPRSTDDDVVNPEQGIELAASGRAIVTLPATLAIGLSHPGVVALPLVDGPSVPTCLVWRSDDNRHAVHCLVSLAGDMTGHRHCNGSS